MWQWVIATEDRSAAAFTTHTVCRTGKKAKTPPQCNYWKCANKDCSECDKDDIPESKGYATSKKDATSKK